MPPTNTDYVDPYDARIAAQRALLAQVPQSRFSSEQIAHRQGENQRMTLLGILGQLSGDEAAGNVGSAVYKSAQADRQPRVTDRGVYNPIRDEYTLNPEVVHEQRRAELGRLEDRSAAGFQQWQQNRQRAQERREDADVQRQFQGGQNAAMRAVLGGGPLVQAIDPTTGQPIFVPRSQAVGMTPSSGGTVTEGERKASSLLKRLEFSQGQMASVVAEHPEAAMPTAQGETLRGIPMVGGAASNLVTSEARQRVEAAQLDILDAALTLGTGAAYTREQLHGYAKSYFPQYGDKPEAIADKAARLQNVIEAARIAAGRAAPSGGQPNAGGPPRALPRALEAKRGAPTAGGGAGGAGGGSQRYIVDY